MVKPCGHAGGAIAGIVIGSVVGGLMILGLIVFLAMKSSGRTKQQGKYCVCVCVLSMWQ